MRIYISENDKASGNKIALDDLMLTSDMPTTAGSKMLDGYMSLFGADVIEKLNKTGFAVSGKVNVGEFSIDLIGETSYYGVCEKDGYLVGAATEALLDNDVTAVVGLDVSGAPRRVAAVGKAVNIKPTYGTVSRYGTIPVACSGETVCVSARTVKECAEVLNIIVGHDDKDGTSLPDARCELVKSGADCRPIKKIALAKSITEGSDEEVRAKIKTAAKTLTNNGIEITEIDDTILAAAKTAWNILMSAEMCNNVSRYDGVKYGYRAKEYRDIDELYTNSRTEAFGELLKTIILYGSEALSTDNYSKAYDKALRIRRVVSERFAEIFKEFDAVLLPACGKFKYTLDDVKANKYISLDENIYTAPASLTGLPAVVAGGVQLIGKTFSEKALFNVADILEKEGK